MTHDESEFYEAEFYRMQEKMGLMRARNAELEAEVKRLKADRDRLFEALKEIADESPIGWGDEGFGYLQDLASEALASRSPKLLEESE